LAESSFQAFAGPELNRVTLDTGKR